MDDIISEHYSNNFDRYVKIYSRKCGSVEDAEDIVQESYYMAIRFKDTFDHNRKFSSWMDQIVFNEFRKFKTSEKLKGMSVEIEEEHFEPQEMPELTAPIMEDIVNSPLPYSKLYELYFVKNYTIKAASDACGIHPSKAYRQLIKFRKKMRKKYK